MAEIKIEKKKPIWPWILVLVIIASLIYFVFFRDHETTETVEIENTTSLNTRTENTKEISSSKEATVAS